MFIRSVIRISTRRNPWFTLSMLHIVRSPSGESFQITPIFTVIMPMKRSLSVEFRYWR